MRAATPYKRYTERKDFDAIVIGSGIGGLTAAALLADHGGKRVLVLERHYTPGGFTHAFKRPGFEWDVGVHYIGQVSDGSSAVRALFDHLTRGELKWADMGEVCDTMVFGDDRYSLPRGKKALRDMLVDRFPRERRGIDRYLALIERTARWSSAFFAEKALPPSLSRAFGSLLRYPFLRQARCTTLDVVSRLTSDARLRGLLTAQWGDYGLPPSRSSFGMHAIVANHYLGGAAYPVGGASRIAETIIATIERHGGTVLTRADVTGLSVENGRVLGVRMADGGEFHAPCVVSDAGAAVTFGQLVPEPLRAALGPGTNLPIEPSTAHLSLYLGIRGSASELGLPKTNVWHFSDYDHDRSVERSLQDPEAPLGTFMSFPSAKDPDFERRFPGRSTIEVIAFTPYSWFAPWRGSRWQKRGPEYEAQKARFEKRLLDVALREVPSIRGRIEHAELSTPLSTRHFTNHPHGEIYGLAHSPARFEARWLRPRTSIQGLFLCGADVCTAGVTGALMGGVLSASAVLGKNLLPAMTKATASPADVSSPGDSRELRGRPADGHRHAVS